VSVRAVLDTEMLGEWDLLDKECASPFLKDTVQLFFSTGYETLAQLELELTRGNLSRFKFLAHRLKGSCLNLGFLRAADYCGLLEGLEALPGNAKETCASIGLTLKETAHQIETAFPRLSGFSI
jgi:HPt (histidine-containing phosphotransfer) domain-containing protein